MMQIVIDIPEEIYNELKTHPLFSSDMPTIERAIKNGTILPKGHGDLIDADKIQFENNEFDTYSDYSKAFNAIYYAPTIIEKDGD